MVTCDCKTSFVLGKTGFIWELWIRAIKKKWSVHTIMGIYGVDKCNYGFKGKNMTKRSIEKRRSKKKPFKY